MKKILVPTDFSEGAYHALQYAVELAKEYGASIDVVNAFYMPPSGSTILVDITDVLKKSADEAMAKLRAKVEASAMHGEVDMRFETHYGSVEQTIAYHVKHKGVDAVVMGTQGAGGITEKWLGTNASSAAKNTEVPLWVIPAGKDFRMPRKILCATDLKMFRDEEPLEYVRQLANKFHSEVKFLHVRQDDSEKPEEKACKEWADERFPVRKPEFVFVHDDDIEDGIEDAVEDEKPDLLVVVRREYGFFKNLFHSSVTRQVVNSADLPILVLKGG